MTNNIGRCYQCGEPIFLDDDAEVCIQCGGRNTRVAANENERLRGLLRDGLTSNIPEWIKRVREALGE